MVHFFTQSHVFYIILRNSKTPSPCAVKDKNLHLRDNISIS